MKKGDGNTFRRRRTKSISVPFVLLLLGAAACSDSPTGPSGDQLSISSISPATGSTIGGTAISIGGKGFGSDATVSIGGAPATGVAVQGTATISAITPATPSAGPVDVVVTSAGRTATMTRGFTFVAPTGANQAPVISSIISIGSRPNQPNGFADLDELVTLIATVTDVETSASSLTYTWSGEGAFSGEGAIVSWRAPATLSPTPSTVTLRLTVAESFSEGGVTHKNVGTGTFVVRVHDSQKEILDMGYDFLARFSQSNIPTDQVLHNFSRTCDGGAGREAEAGDVDRNRSEVTYTGYRIDPLPPVKFNFGGVCIAKVANRADACANFRVHWEFVDKQLGRGVADGTGHLTAAYENNRWYLCHSNYTALETFRALGITRPVTW
jgi:hypothetical protein